MWGVGEIKENIINIASDGVLYNGKIYNWPWIVVLTWYWYWHWEIQYPIKYKCTKT